MHLAAQETGKEERIRIVDSGNLSTGLGILVTEAAGLAKEGACADEIVRYLEDLKPRICTSFVIDTLKYLHMGGRCSGLSAFAGSTLKLHPLIRMEDGVLHVRKKYHGSIDKCLLRYVEELSEELSRANPVRVFLTASMPEDTPVVGEIRGMLEALHHFDRIIFAQAGALISSHCGPGASGIIYSR